MNDNNMGANMNINNNVAENNVIDSNAGASAQNTVMDAVNKQMGRKQQTPEQKKKAAIGAVIAIVVFIGIMLLMTFLSRAGLDRRLDATLETCSEYGTSSTECKEAQKKNDVTCSYKIEGFYCEGTYNIYF